MEIQKSGSNTEVGMKSEIEKWMKSSSGSIPGNPTTMMKDSGIEGECPLCKGRGWVFTDYNTVKECECGLIERERQKSKLRFATIPETYKDVRLKDFVLKYYSQENKDGAKSIVEVVKYWLEHKDEMTEGGKGLYFWSDAKGSGKTMLAAAIANELLNNHKEFVKFATSLDILDEIRRTYNRKFNSEENNESKLLQDLASVKYLMIDDFGTEKVTDWVGEKFYQIVNSRYINKKVTFFTSNYDLETIDYDSRITTRIRERAFVVHFPEESVRDVKARQENRIES